MKRKTISFILTLAMVFAHIPAMPSYAAGLPVGSGETYTTLADALAAAVSGDTITLSGDVTEITACELDTTVKNSITINGQGHKVTGVGGTSSAALQLKGTGTVILNNITLQGGTASTVSNEISTGLKVSGSANVKSIGTVNSSGGPSTSGYSYGVWNTGSGTVNVSNATGGLADNCSVGVENDGSGTVNVANATGGTASNPSVGVWNASSGTVNVTNATGGDSTNVSYGVISEGTGTVNVTNATAANASSSNGGIGVRCYNPGTINVTNAIGGVEASNYGVENIGTTTVNVGTASGGPGGINSTSGTVNTGAAITTLTLNKGAGADCVLASITIASSGSTRVGALPQVTKNGVQGDWYTDSANTITFSGISVTGITNLYSTFYQTTYTISAIANQTMMALTSGYGSGSQETKTLTITRTGTGDLASLATALSGANAASFTITQPAITTLNSGTPSTTFEVKAKDGLAAGTYTATVTISATNMANQTFTVTQVVNADSSGGGSGGGGSSPATSVINTNTGSVTGNQLKIAADAAKDGGTVTIKSDKTSEVSFPNSGLDSLSGKNNSLTVVTDKGTLTFDSKAVGAMGTQATATDIKVIVDDVVKTTLTEEQQTKVGDKTVYDLSVMSGGKLISSFNGGKVNVSIPYELKTGETAENLTVWYMADNGSLTEINCTYDAKNKAVTFVVDHFSKYIIGQDGLAGWANPFTDVKSSAWYYDAVAFVNTNGLMKGQTDTVFGPQTSMTRGMFVTILGRMEGIDATLYASKNTFSDVKSNQYYAPYIAWANEKGIVTGMGGDKFAPSASVTREQMAVMMTNYLKFKGQGPAGTWAIQLTYGDLDKVSSWADEAVMFLTMKDLMNGMGNDAKGNTLFAPKSTSTRAQTAQVMMSLGELVN